MVAGAIDPFDFIMEDSALSCKVVEEFGEFLVTNMTLAREAVQHFVDGMKGAEKAKAEMVLHQIDDYIKQLHKAAKLKGLRAFLKILGPLGLALAALAAVICPSPMTIALLVVCLVMFLEPMISKATGHDSLIEKGIGELFKKLMEAMPPAAAGVLAAVVVLVLVVACTAALAAGMSAAASFVSSSTSLCEGMGAILSKLPQILGEALKNGLTPAQEAQIRLFLEFFQSIIMAAQGGVSIDVALLNKKVAELLAACQMDQADIDAWTKLIDMIGNDQEAWQSQLGNFQNMLIELGVSNV